MSIRSAFAAGAIRLPPMKLVISRILLLSSRTSESADVGQSVARPMTAAPQCLGSEAEITADKWSSRAPQRRNARHAGTAQE